MKQFLEDLVEILTRRKEKKFLKEVREGKWVVWGGAAFPKKDVEEGRIILMSKNSEDLMEMLKE